MGDCLQHAMKCYLLYAGAPSTPRMEVTTHTLWSSPNTPSFNHWDKTLVLVMCPKVDVYPADIELVFFRCCWGNSTQFSSPPTLYVQTSRSGRTGPWQATHSADRTTPSKWLSNNPNAFNGGAEDMSGRTRALPTWMISKLSKPDVLLNRLPVNDLLRLLKKKR